MPLCRAWEVRCDDCFQRAREGWGPCELCVVWWGTGAECAAQRLRPLHDALRPTKTSAVWHVGVRGSLENPPCLQRLQYAYARVRLCTRPVGEGAGGLGALRAGLECVLREPYVCLAPSPWMIALCGRLERGRPR
jgi:hypothetical protein